MHVIAQADRKQLDEVELTLTVTMKLKDWREVSSKIREGIRASYYEPAQDLISCIKQSIDKYTHTVDNSHEVQP